MKLTYGVKKLLSVLSAISIAVCCLPFAAAAVDDDEWEIWGNIKYCIDGETLTIAPKDGMATAAMPDAETAKDVPWYSDRKNITLVTIKDGITHIGDYAFYEFTNIWRVYDAECPDGSGISTGILKYPASLESFGVGSFMKCSKLSTFIFPDNLYSADGEGNYGEIPDSLFKGCSSLVTVTIQQDSRTKLNYNEKFSVKLPGKNNRIGKYAFSGCKNLRTTNNNFFDIPISVIKIDDYAFENCSSIEKIRATSATDYISASAFNGCTSLMAFTFWYWNSDYFYTTGSELYNKSQTTLVRIMPAYSGTEYTVLDTVKEIGDYAFNSSVNLEKITIPDGVKSIGEFAFSNCKNLSEVYLPKSIEKIDPSAFGYYAPNVNVYYDGTKEDFLKIDGAYLIDISVTMHYSAAVGDLHQDGKIDILDLIALKKAIAENSERTDQNDINSDGKLDAGDIVSLRKMILGL